MAETEHYATAANFGLKQEQVPKRPWVKEVTVPESIKRKYPSKHYVYKVVVKWTNETKTVIYRRYSSFFDFVVKLQELVAKLRKINPKLEDTDLELPELPSKSLFSRSQTHQVAEKRRRKVEEFCQQLILLPPEISESGLVLGFFNIWPDDTLLRDRTPGIQHVISAPVLVPNRSASPTPLLKTTDSSAPLLKTTDSSSSITGVTSPTSPPHTAPPDEPQYSSVADAISGSNNALDSIISHPDEMEHLEQYRVLGNYEAKDSHQVDLFTGQLVHVIEKHDTGWWMVMSEDEQGYAPAAFLEPLDGNSMDKDMYPQTNSDEVYEAMEEYTPISEDEIGFKVHDKIKVIAKSMDGWWKIRCNGKTGFAPAALIRRVQEDNDDSNFGFESERAIYEELNIHHPPPRRNTLERSAANHVPPGYLSPRSNPELANIMEENIYCDPAEDSPDEDMGGENIYCDPAEELSDQEEDNHIYKVPRLSSDQPPTPVRQRSLSKELERSRSGSETSSVHSTHFGSDGVPHGYDTVRKGSDNVPHGYDIVRRGSEGLPGTGGYVSVPARKGSSSSQRSKSSSVSPPPREIDERTERLTGSIDNVRQEVNKQTQSNLPSTPPKPKVAPKPAPPPKPKPKVDASEHNKYVSMKGPSEPRAPGKADSTSKHSTPAAFQFPVNDYEDLDALEEQQGQQLIPALDDYVDMSGSSPLEDLRKSDELAKASPTKAGAPEPPPRVSNKSTPGSKPKLGLAKSFSIDPELPVFEEEYVMMDSTPTNKSPPLTVSSVPTQNSLKTKGGKPKPPAPYNSPKASGKPSLVRAKSMEDILSSTKDLPDFGKQHSPPLPRKNPFAPPLPARNPPSTKPVERAQPVEKDVSFLPLKPKPGKTRNPFKRNNKQPQMANGHANDESNDPLPHPKPRPGGVGPERSISPIARHSISPPGMRERSPHPPLVHTNSEPPVDIAELKRTQYVAVFSFGAPSDRCLGFSVGDKCELVKKNKETGWWLVKMGSKVGWTPGEYWKEAGSSRDRSVTNAPHPPAPTPTRKPRSHTVAEVTTVPELAEGHDREPISRGLASSVEGEMSALTDSGRHQSAGGRGKGLPPPKPKPLPEAGSPLSVRKPKPTPPQKYGNTSSVSARGGGSPTPPPLPPANATRRLGSHSSVPEVGGAVTSRSPAPPPKPGVPDGDECVMLDEVSTIEKAAWFAGKMERVQAESFLMENGRQREFLVRERTNKDGYYALSVRYHYNIRHFNIDPTSDGHYCMGTLVFPSIEEIIKHYQTNSLFIHDSQHVTLGQAVSKKRSSRLADPSKVNGV